MKEQDFYPQWLEEQDRKITNDVGKNTALAIDFANDYVIELLEEAFSENERQYKANRFIQTVIDNGWNLNSDQQKALTQAYVLSLSNELRLVL